jgi:hypothetical protein
MLAAAVPVPVSGQTEYLAVLLMGKKIGHAVQKRVVADGKVTTMQEASMELSRIGVPLTFSMTETAIETTEGEPLGFMVIQNFGMMAEKIIGKINNRGMLEVTTTSMGSVNKEIMEWPRGAIMFEGLRLLTLKKGLKEGTSYTAKIFSPGLSMEAVETQIQIGAKRNVDLLGRVVELTEVVTIMKTAEAGGIVTTRYVDDELRDQKTITPVAEMQVEMIVCSKEFALGQNDVVELVNKMFLPSPQPLDNVGSAKAISYHLKPTSPTANLMFPSTDSQQAKKLPDGSVIVAVRPFAAPSGGRFPYRGRDEAILEATEPTRFLQSDRREIIELARRAVGNSKDAGEAVKRIEAFVASYIENKNLSVGYASAAEVAASRQGDCTEFSVLTAAMCRAVGIPAQVVMGVAYVDDFVGLQKGFGGHAWVQAYVGGKWVSLDAAFKGTGRGGYDAGHIAQAVGNGDPGDFFNIITTLGQFKIDKIIVSKE